MAIEIAGNYDATGRRFAIVVGRFNAFISDKLLEGALDALTRHGVEADNIAVVRCPGSYEIPLVAKKLAEGGSYDAVICLGAIIRGATYHFEAVANVAARGVADAALATGVPIVFGVVTTDTIEQAIERAGTKAGNRGADAAMAAIEMANLLGKL